MSKLPAAAQIASMGITTMIELDKCRTQRDELLAALQDLLDMPEADGTFSMGKLRKSIKDRAKAAIAKATGENHG